MIPKQSVALAVLALTLAACGPSGNGEHRGGPSSDALNDACRALGDATAIFGADADVRGYAGLEDMASTCEFASADGAHAGEIILYTAQSLGEKNAETRMGEITQQWDAQTETPLAAIEGVGEAAQLAKDLPGYQVQIAFRKGGSLVLISARSGDARPTDEALARSMAQAAAANLP